MRTLAFVFVLLIVCAMAAPPTKARVIILGAGMAGIKAANELATAGVEDFLILEGTDRVGGRLWDVDFDGVHVEVGANWIEGEEEWFNPIWKLKQAVKLEGNFPANGTDHLPMMFNATDRIDPHTVHDTFLGCMKDAMHWSHELQRERQPDVTLRHALERAGWHPSNAIEEAIEYWHVDWDAAVPAQNVSLFTFFPVAGTARRGYAHSPYADGADGQTFGRGGTTDPKRFFVSDPRGYVEVIHHLARQVLAPNDPRLLLNRAVTRIAYNRRGVTVYTATGEIFTADYALCTFSIGVLSSSSLQFSPPLPAWKRSRIDQLMMGVYTKIFVKFPHAFWPDVDYFLYADQERGRYPVWQTLPHASNVLLATVTTLESLRIEQQADTVTKAEMMEVLHNMFGKNIPDAESILVPRWGQNQFFHGSYSNVKVGTTGQDFRMLQAPVEGVLFFAGEATNADYNGYVEGAFYSGITGARDILLEIRKKEEGF